MNKFERQGRQPADQQTLPEAIGDEFAQLPAEIVDIIDAPPIAPRPPLLPGEVRTILMSLMLTMFLAALDQTIVATALPTIGRQFRDVSSLSWVITAYLLASTAVIPLYGKIADIHGRRFTLRIAILTYMAGSLVCALAPNMLVLILGRVLHGLGGGGLSSMGMVVLADLVSPKERGRYYSYFAATYTTAGGSAVATMVWSSAERNIASMAPTMTTRIPAGASDDINRNRWRCAC